MPAAAVVIPTRNRRSQVERAIRSVLTQTLGDWQLVVVDDASTDDTAAFLDSLDDPRIHVARLAGHAERSVARNRGLELATAPAVLFLDDDDELLPAGLALLTEALARHSEACASVGASVHQTDSVRSRPSFPKRSQLIDVRLELVAGWVALGGQSLMRTDAVKDLGGWREGLSVAEDQELWLRLCSRGRVAIVPEAVLIHRPHGLAGDAPGFRDVERAVVAAYLRAAPGGDARAERAATAREHLRDADIAFGRGAYRAALLASVRGILAAPFLLKSPLIGRGLAKGLGSALIAGALPRGAAEGLRNIARRRRARASSTWS